LRDVATDEQVEASCGLAVRVGVDVDLVNADPAGHTGTLPARLVGHLFGPVDADEARRGEQLRQRLGYQARAAAGLGDSAVARQRVVGQDGWLLGPVQVALVAQRSLPLLVLHVPAIGLTQGFSDGAKFRGWHGILSGTAAGGVQRVGWRGWRGERTGRDHESA